MNYDKKDTIWLILTATAVFILLFIGVWSSPTFTEKQNYIEAMVMFGAMLFIFSVVLIVAWLGFRTFSLFLSILLAMAISLYGVKAGFIMVGMTYIVWGFAFAIQLLLVHNGQKEALNWFKKRYTVKTFQNEYKAFYPMLWLLYFLLEIVPHYIFKESIIDFSPKELYEAMSNELS